MKRHIFAIVCVLLLGLTALVGCDGHEHTYSDAWTVNDTHHWHKSTCEEGDECADAKASEATHVDINKDSICDVCAYDYNHTHEFADEYSSDENSHWYEATCECSIPNKDEALHVDADNDGTCDVCEYSSCEHTYNTLKWAVDESGHWHATTCGHSVKADAAEHDYNDADICEVCQYHDGVVDTAAAVKIGGYYGDTVNSGYVIYESDYDETNTIYIQYVFGEKHTAITEVRPEETYERHFELVDGNLFAIQDYTSQWGNETTKYTDATSAAIDGYKFSEVFSYNDDEVEGTYYGVEDLVTSLYAMAEESPEFSEFMIVDGEGATAYVFSFMGEIYVNEWAYKEVFNWDTYEYENVQYTAYHAYFVTVTFTLGEENNFEFVNVTSEYYELDPIFPEVEAPEAGEGDAETANEEEAAPVEPIGFNKMSLRPSGAESYTIAQETGARNAAPKYNSAEILATDFDLLDAAGNVIDPDGVIEVTAGQYFNLSVVAKNPETANIALDNVIFVDGTIEPSFYYYGGCTGDFHSYTEGEYYFTIKTINSEEKTYVVKVLPKPLTEIYPQAQIDGVYQESYNYSVGYTGTDVIVNIKAVPNVEGHTYTATMPASDMATFKDNGDGTYTITAKGVGTFVVTFVADVETVTATFTLNVTPPPTLESLGLKGNTYKPVGMVAAAPDMTLVFGESSVEITNNSYNAEGTTPAALLKSGTYNITVEADGTLVITDSTGAPATFSITASYGSYSLVLGRGYQNIFNLQQQNPSEGGGAGSGGGTTVDVAAAIAGKEFESTINGAYGPRYIINFSSKEICDTDLSTYTKFEYTVEGNKIIFTGTSILATATVEYKDGKIVATLADSTVVTFNEYVGW